MLPLTIQCSHSMHHRPMKVNCSMAVSSLFIVLLTNNCFKSNTLLSEKNECFRNKYQSESAGLLQFAKLRNRTTGFSERYNCVIFVEVLSGDNSLKLRINFPGLIFSGAC